MNDNKIIAGIVVIILTVGGGLFWMSGGSGALPSSSSSEAPAGAPELAQCLVDKGAIFYGAFWCSHCQKQKRNFGSAEKILPYIECSTPDGKGQLPICIEKGIKSYPTWRFADGSEMTGELSFATLREKSGCSAGAAPKPEAAAGESVTTVMPGSEVTTVTIPGSETMTTAPR